MSMGRQMVLAMWCLGTEEVTPSQFVLFFSKKSQNPLKTRRLKDLWPCRAFLYCCPTHMLIKDTYSAAASCLFGITGQAGNGIKLQNHIF